MADRQNKRVSIQDKNGVLLVKGNFVRVPYSLLRSETFHSLSPLAVKIYFIFLEDWKQHKYDEEIKITLIEIQKRCPSRYKKKDEHGNIINGHAGFNQLVKAILELAKNGLIEIHKHGQGTNTYEITTEWFTGRYS